MKKAICAVLFIIMCSFSACTIGNVDIVFEEETKKELLFSLGEHGGCSKEEMIVYFLLAKADYEEVFGEEIWDMKLDDMPMEEFVKNNILAKAFEEKSMSALAKSKGLVLDESETGRIAKKAKELYKVFVGNQSAEVNITVEDIVSVLTDSKLSELAFEYITKDVDTEITDAEAKVITVQYIKCELKGKDYDEALLLMEDIYELLDDNKFDTIAARYEGQTVSAVEDVRKGERLELTGGGRVLEDILFELSDGELSGIISVDNDAALYIFKSVEDYNPDKTEDNKAVILEKRKNDTMKLEYDAFVNGIECTFDAEMWENLHFDEWV